MTIPDFKQAFKSYDITYFSVSWKRSSSSSKNTK